MRNIFEGFENDLKDLDPRAKEKAKEIASRLMERDDYDEAGARKEAVQRAAQWHFNLEG